MGQVLAQLKLRPTTVTIRLSRVAWSVVGPNFSSAGPINRFSRRAELQFGHVGRRRN